MGSCSGMLIIYIIVGLSALLVSTDRAIPEPQHVKRVTETGSTFFCICTYLLDWTTSHRGSQVTKAKFFMYMTEMISYEAPQVEIVEVEVEKGFAISGEDTTYGAETPGWQG